ncbi:MAG: Gfo/Idh/MocA family protein [Bacteroidia bacterium]
MQALLIGCGNIGALYDLDDATRVWTHAKAFSKISEINFSVADTDKKLAKKIADHYQVERITITGETDFSSYDIISITTPTPTHFTFLEALFNQKVPVIICEKPVAANKEELKKLANLYKKSGCKVLVNYVRRFQPAYERLKKLLIKQQVSSPCTGINIKYQRGLLNNGGHAFDLLEFLFEKPFSLNAFHLQDVAFDVFSYDPTVSGSCLFDTCPVTILGIRNSSFPIFEIELFFPALKIVICHSGDEVRFYEYKKKESRLVENQKLRQSNILPGYMLPVVNKAIKLLKNKNEADNFLQAVELNNRIVHVISKIS